MTRAYFVLALSVLAVVALAGTHWGAYRHGVSVERIKHQAAETERMRAIAEAVGETVTRSNALAVEVEQLRARPERIRTVTKTRTVHVQADAECRSAPESVRLLWNAGTDADPPAGAARVVDGLMPRVAGDGR